MKQSKKTLILIFLVCLTPILLANLFFYVLRPSGFTNHGVLLSPPADIKKALLATSVSLDEPTNGKWVLLTSTTQSCETVCKRTLFYLNQLKKSTGEESNRVIALALLPSLKNAVEQTKLSAELTQLADLTPFYLPNHHAIELEGVFNQLRPQDVALDRFQFKEHLLEIWIVDPNGNAILYYPPGADPNKLKKDLAKLLKVSRIG